VLRAQALFALLNDDGALHLLQDSLESAAGPVKALLLQLAHKRVQAALQPKQQPVPHDAAVVEPLWLSRQAAELFVVPVGMAVQKLRSSQTKPVPAGRVHAVLSAIEWVVAALNTLRFVCLRTGELPASFAAAAAGEGKRLQLKERTLHHLLVLLQERVGDAKRVMLAQGGAEADALGFEHVLVVTEHLLELCAPREPPEEAAPS
jgi:hypothetical protein